MSDCCFTIRARVADICCDDDACNDAELIVSLDGDGMVTTHDGQVLDCGPVGTFQVDPDTCCVETCPLPVNSGHDQPTTYTATLRTANGNNFTVDRLFFDDAAFPAICGGIVAFENLTDYQI